MEEPTAPTREPIQSPQNDSSFDLRDDSLSQYSSSHSNSSSAFIKNDQRKFSLFSLISIALFLFLGGAFFSFTSSSSLLDSIHKVHNKGISSLSSFYSTYLGSDVVIKQPWQKRSNNYKLSEKNLQIQKLNRILFPKSLSELEPEEEDYHHILPYIYDSEKPSLSSDGDTQESENEQSEEEESEEEDLSLDYSNYNRRLGIKKKVYKPPVPCVICRGLQTCTILNGYQVEEVYYPNRLTLLETCKVIDSFGLRISNLIFGPSTTFRDTPLCREIVMQYLCLFYGSENDMYTNYCLYQEDVSDPNPSFHKVAARPPCRSFCVQVSNVCANDPDTFIESCLSIECPPVEDECTPDPILSGQVLDAKLQCSIPYYSSPYFRSSSIRTHHLSAIVYFSLLFLSFIYLF